MVDVGGESTRPGAKPVAEAEELRRVVPVVEALAPHVRVSIDTRKAAVAEGAIAAGATLVNDVSASLHAVAAAGGVGWVAMHMQGDPRTMQHAPSYDDVVAEVRDFLVARADELRVRCERVCRRPSAEHDERASHCPEQRARRHRITSVNGAVTTRPWALNCKKRRQVPACGTSTPTRKRPGRVDVPLTRVAPNEPAHTNVAAPQTCV